MIHLIQPPNDHRQVHSQTQEAWRSELHALCPDLLSEVVDPYIVRLHLPNNAVIDVAWTMHTAEGVARWLYEASLVPASDKMPAHFFGPRLLA